MKTRALCLCLLLVLASAWLWAQNTAQANPVPPVMVNVTGQVKQPGQYSLTIFNRLSDAIRAADTSASGLSSSSVIPQIKPNALPVREDSLEVNAQALRSVRLVRDAQTREYDLLRYLNCGDLSQNPLLRDGDLIFVPSVSQYISITGAVYKPRDYQYKATDTLAGILELSGGPMPRADLSAIKVYRYADNMVDFEVLEYDISSYTQNPAVAEVALQDGDRILVPSNSAYRGGRKVFVQGRVANPGEYLVNDDTGIYDVLRMAGGLMDDADIASAIYMNRPFSEELDPEFERLKEMNYGQLSSVEYSYLRAKLRQIKGRYSVDIASVWANQGTEGDLKLMDGDLIYVPQKMDMIWVSGHVAKPGLVPIVEGATWRDYVEAAGGFLRGYRSSRIRIIRADSGNWVKPGARTALYPGDTIFVPERIERDFWVDVKDVVLLATQLITIVVGVSALTK